MLLQRSLLPRALLAAARRVNDRWQFQAADPSEGSLHPWPPPARVGSHFPIPARCPATDIVAMPQAHRQKSILGTAFAAGQISSRSNLPIDGYLRAVPAMAEFLSGPRSNDRKDLHER